MDLLTSVVADFTISAVVPVPHSFHIKETQRHTMKVGNVSLLLQAAPMGKSVLVISKTSSPWKGALPQ